MKQRRYACIMKIRANISLKYLYFPEIHFFQSQFFIKYEGGGIP